MKITATVITHNEEHNIAAALGSLRWADEIVVVDSESDDGTVEIARTFTDRIFVRPWPGYSAQKNFAAEQASNDWIFSIDADERVSSELARELELLKTDDQPRYAGFRMPRMVFYLGRWIKHSGWYPDYKLRLYDRSRARWEGDFVHETLKVDGPIGTLKGVLLHYTVRDVSEHHSRLDRYTTLAAQQAFAAGKRATAWAMLFSPPLTFLRAYVFKWGFLDGWQGLVIAGFAAHYTFLKLAKLCELELKQSADRHE
ncbi:MAG TPA: glycosyltransferase family 2 protein [Blastocatellia bacterium]|nr:glycosyltransferase family 2 protein [Blastocatellia bacterium]